MQGKASVKSSPLGERISISKRHTQALDRNRLNGFEPNRGGWNDSSGNSQDIAKSIRLKSKHSIRRQTMRTKYLLMTAIFAALFTTLPTTGLTATGGSGGLNWTCIPGGECTCKGRVDCDDMKDTLDCMSTGCSGMGDDYECSCTRWPKTKAIPQNKQPIRIRPGKIGVTQPKGTIKAQPPKKNKKTGAVSSKPPITQPTQPKLPATPMKK